MDFAALLAWHILALLVRNILALRPGDVLAGLARHVHTGLAGDVFTSLPGNFNTRLLWDVEAGLCRNILALRRWGVMALLLVHQRALLLVHVVADFGGNVFALFRVVDFGADLLGHRVTLLRVFGRAFLLLNCLAFFLGHGIAGLNVSLRALPAMVGLALLDVFGGALLV